MSKKSLIFHLVAHKGYFKNLETENISKNQILFVSISQVYLPLLNMFANLESDGIPFKMGMIIASTSLVIMEIEGTNSRSTLGMVSGLLQFH